MDHKRLRGRTRNFIEANKRTTQGEHKAHNIDTNTPTEATLIIDKPLLGARSSLGMAAYQMNMTF